MANLSSLMRYPIKGLSGEGLYEVTLTAGDYFPSDRFYAIENGPSGYDPDKPEHQSKFKFCVLARMADLARLKTRYDHGTGTLTIEVDGIEAASGDLETAEGRKTIEDFITLHLADNLSGPAKVIRSVPGFRFTDSRSGFVSLINLESLRSLGRETGYPVDPVRFRGNLMIEGLPAWSEFSWVGKKIRIGSDVVLMGLKRTERCAATTVNPRNGQRDLMVPAILMRSHGHADCGIYASVINSGTIRAGDRITIEEDERAGLPFS